MNAKTKSLVEHYVIAVATAGVAIYQGGNHDIKKVAWAALVGVLGPVAKAAWGKLDPNVKAEITAIALDPKVKEEISAVESKVKAKVKKTAK